MRAELSRWDFWAVEFLGHLRSLNMESKKQVLVNSSARKLSKIIFASIVFFATFDGAAMSQERMPSLDKGQYDPAQEKAAEQFSVERKMPVFGPFVPLIRSPEFMTDAASMGTYLRYRSAVPQKLTEFTILIMARQWMQDYVWYIHFPLAIKAGVAPEIAKAISEGRRPDKMSSDEEVVYDFVTEVNDTKRVSDITYARAQKLLGDRGIIDLTGLQGYYTLLSITLNVTRLQPPPDSFRFPRLPN